MLGKGVSLQARQLLAASLGLLAFLGFTGYALDRAFVDTANSNLRQRLQNYAWAFMQSTELLRNGDFRSELRHWLPAVEGHADPWHARNAVLQLLFEQGVVGLLVGGGLVLLALGRLLIGPARDHPLAPALTAALLAFLVVGQFESLVDVPRLALLFFVCLMLGLGLRAPPPPPIPKPA